MRPRYSCFPSTPTRLLGCVSSRRSITTAVARFAKAAKGPARKGKQPPLYVPTKVKLRDVTEGELPPLEFWQRRAGVENLTPEWCYSATHIYLQHYNPKESTWKGKLERDYDITPQRLNSLAVVLVANPHSASWRLGLNMLGTASDLGSESSTLLLIRLLSQSSSSDRLSKTPLLVAALSRFRHILRKKQDPDALTLQGLILANEGDDGKALEFFSQAMEVGSPNPSSGGQQQDIRPPWWGWEASCHLTRARILLQQGRREEAIAAFRVAAVELDHAQAYFKLATLLAEDSPERGQYLQKAAVSGVPEACQLLGESEVRMAEQPDQPKEKVREHCLWASEWFSLAGNPTKREKTPVPA